MSSAPHSTDPRQVNRSPQWLDARSLALHELIAQKLRQDPGKIDKALAQIQYWKALPTFDRRTLPYMDRWEKILNEGLESTVAAATDPSEAGNELRQASPFPGVLSHQERFHFFNSWSLR